MRWNCPPVNEAEVAGLAARLGISVPAATILNRLGLQTAEAAEAFLDPKLRSLADPFLVANMGKAVERVRLAMEREEKVVVFGDYDVDGITSTAFLVSILNSFGVYPRFIVPRRLEEGYGLSLTAVERVLEGGVPGLLIAVDCGTSSVREVAYLRERGVDVLILDHHTSKSGLPADCIIVNPHVFDEETAPWRHLCTVGLVFKFVHGFLKQLRDEGDDLAAQIQLKDYLDFVALGTVADLVPLRDENRILARSGLLRLRETARPGLNALYEVSRIKLGEPITPWDIAFRLGPRINASGRLADAAVPIEMLLSEDYGHCLNSARQLDDFNRERQDIERQITQQAEEMIEAEQGNAPGYVLFHPDWHPGVVGIVASRVVQKYHRPALVFGSEGDMAKGSGRSVNGLNLVEVLTPCADLLEHWGGHPMAVGIALKQGSVDGLREAFCASLQRKYADHQVEPSLEISCWLRAQDVGNRLLGELDRLGPFGQGNPEPVFGIRGVTLRQPPQAFGQGHVRFFMETTPGNTISVVAWKMAETAPPVGKALDFAARLNWNAYNDRRYPQLTLIDWRESN